MASMDRQKLVEDKKQELLRRIAEKKKNSQIPSQDLKLIIWKVLCRHLTKVSLTLVVHLLLDYLYALFDLVFSIIYI